jgi:hypothetical protein
MNRGATPISNVFSTTSGPSTGLPNIGGSSLKTVGQHRGNQRVKSAFSGHRPNLASKSSSLVPKFQTSDEGKGAAYMKTSSNSAGNNPISPEMAAQIVKNYILPMFESD